MLTYELSLVVVVFLDQSIFVGVMTKRQLRKLLDKGDISQSQVTEFYKGVRAFYVALDNLPLTDELLMNFVERLVRSSMHTLYREAS